MSRSSVFCRAIRASPAKPPKAIQELGPRDATPQTNPHARTPDLLKTGRNFLTPSNGTEMGRSIEVGFMTMQRGAKHG